MNAYYVEYWDGKEWRQWGRSTRAENSNADKLWALRAICSNQNNGAETRAVRSEDREP
jgi:hypothetical protein